MASSKSPPFASKQIPDSLRAIQNATTRTVSGSSNRESNDSEASLAAGARSSLREPSIASRSASSNELSQTSSGDPRNKTWSINQANSFESFGSVELDPIPVGDGKTLEARTQVNEDLLDGEESEEVEEEESEEEEEEEAQIGERSHGGHDRAVKGQPPVRRKVMQQDLHESRRRPRERPLSRPLLDDLPSTDEESDKLLIKPSGQRSPSHESSASPPSRPTISFRPSHLQDSSSHVIRPTLTFTPTDRADSFSIEIGRRPHPSISGVMRGVGVTFTPSSPMSPTPGSLTQSLLNAMPGSRSLSTPEFSSLDGWQGGAHGTEQEHGPSGGEGRPSKPLSPAEEYENGWEARHDGRPGTDVHGKRAPSQMSIAADGLSAAEDDGFGEQFSANAFEDQPDPISPNEPSSASVFQRSKAVSPPAQAFQDASNKLNVRKPSQSKALQTDTRGARGKRKKSKSVAHSTSTTDSPATVSLSFVRGIRAADTSRGFASICLARSSRRTPRVL